MKTPSAFLLFALSAVTALTPTPSHTLPARSGDGAARTPSHSGSGHLLAGSTPSPSGSNRLLAGTTPSGTGRITGNPSARTTPLVSGRPRVSSTAAAYHFLPGGATCTSDDVKKTVYHINGTFLAKMEISKKLVKPPKSCVKPASLKQATSRLLSKVVSTQPRAVIAAYAWVDGKEVSPCYDTFTLAEPPTTKGARPKLIQCVQVKSTSIPSGSNRLLSPSSKPSSSGSGHVLTSARTTPTPSRSSSGSGLYGPTSRPTNTAGR
ncbi:hypothetical protein PYCC9005_002973 [Savitreella phatthalungensis]